MKEEPRTAELEVAAAITLDPFSISTVNLFKSNIFSLSTEFIPLKLGAISDITRLKLPLNDSMKYVQKIVMMSSRPIIIAEEIVTDSAVRRLIYDAGDSIDDLLTLCEADITTKNKRKFEKYHNNFKIVREKIKKVEEKDNIRNFQPPVTGEVIMKHFKIGPCKDCLLYTSPSPRDGLLSRMPSSA